MLSVLKKSYLILLTYTHNLIYHEWWQPVSVPSEGLQLQSADAGAADADCRARANTRQQTARTHRHRGSSMRSRRAYWRIRHDHDRLWTRQTRRNEKWKGIFISLGMCTCTTILFSPLAQVLMVDQRSTCRSSSQQCNKHKPQTSEKKRRQQSRKEGVRRGCIIVIVNNEVSYVFSFLQIKLLVSSQDTNSTITHIWKDL